MLVNSCIITVLEKMMFMYILLEVEERKLSEYNKE